jgi:hypothetical protein
MIYWMGAACWCVGALFLSFGITDGGPTALLAMMVVGIPALSWQDMIDEAPK